MNNGSLAVQQTLESCYTLIEYFLSDCFGGNYSAMWSLPFCIVSHPNAMKGMLGGIASPVFLISC